MKTLLIINIDETQEPRKWMAEGFDTLFLSYSGLAEFRKLLTGYNCWWFDFSKDNKGKWKNIKRAIEGLHYFGNHYSHCWFPDPDLDITTNKIVAMLNYVAELRVEVFQPSLTLDSHCSHQFLKHVPNGRYRQVEFIEIMCPGFTSAALRKNIWTFDLNYSGYGIDLLWGRDNECFVIDRYQVRHSRPPSYWDRAEKKGFPDPLLELDEIKSRYFKG